MTLAGTGFSLADLVTVLMAAVLVVAVLVEMPSPARMAARDTVGLQSAAQIPYLPSPFTCTPEASTWTQGTSM